MATVQTRINNWRKSELRGEYQVNNEVALLRYNKWLQIFQKELLEYVANQWQTTSVALPTEAGRDTYALPFDFNIKGQATGDAILTDFYSIIQLRVAYDTDKNGNPKYRVCEPITLADYNITSKGKSKWAPYIRGRISKLNPRYTFVNTYEDGKVQTHIKLFPTPEKTITGWISLNFNYINKEVEAGTNEDTLGLPWYFLDVIDDYMSYRLFQAENPELAGGYYQQFINTIHNNIYGLNRDQRAVEEEFANLRSLYHN